jgi:hypothetical protein
MPKPVRSRIRSIVLVTRVLVDIRGRRRSQNRGLYFEAAFPRMKCDSGKSREF